MKPTKIKLQNHVQPYLQKDEKGEYLSFEDAEMLIEQIIDEYEGVTCRYDAYYPGFEELLITPIKGKTSFLTVRIKR